MTKDPAPPERPQIEDPNPKVHGVGHPHIDRRMLEMARLTAEKIDRDPELLQIAIDNLERWAHMDDHGLSRALAEWKDLIDRHSWPELRAILVQDTDEGQRLRSSSPFSGIISEEERMAILKRFPRGYGSGAGVTD